jgi:hypothetical protein
MDNPFTTMSTSVAQGFLGGIDYSAGLDYDRGLNLTAFTILHIHIPLDTVRNHICARHLDVSQLGCFAE